MPVASSNAHNRFSYILSQISGSFIACLLVYLQWKGVILVSILRSDFLHCCSLTFLSVSRRPKLLCLRVNWHLYSSRPQDRLASSHSMRRRVPTSAMSLLTSFLPTLLSDWPSGRVSTLPTSLPLLPPCHSSSASHSEHGNFRVLMQSTYEILLLFSSGVIWGFAPTSRMSFCLCVRLRS